MLVREPDWDCEFVQFRPVERISILGAGKFREYLAQIYVVHRWRKVSRQAQISAEFAGPHELRRSASFEASVAPLKVQSQNRLPSISTRSFTNWRRVDRFPIGIAKGVLGTLAVP